jgi:predicted RecB family endonuclease
MYEHDDLVVMEINRKVDLLNRLAGSPKASKTRVRQDSSEP